MALELEDWLKNSNFEKHKLTDELFWHNYYHDYLIFLKNMQNRVAALLLI